MSERESFWKQIITQKFREEKKDRCSLEAREVHGVGLWKAIKRGQGAFKGKIRFIVGNGKRVKIWKDTYVRISFPHLFVMYESKLITQGIRTHAFPEISMIGSLLMLKHSF